MKKTTEQKSGDEMRKEYDFSCGQRGKHAQRFAQGTHIVVLDPDVAKVFPDAATVNDSLRALAGIIRKSQRNLVAK